MEQITTNEDHSLAFHQNQYGAAGRFPGADRFLPPATTEPAISSGGDQETNAAHPNHPHAGRAAKEAALTVERLREVLDYNPETGAFRWKVNTGNNTRVGAIAGTLVKGYRFIRIDNVRYSARRLAQFFREVRIMNTITERTLMKRINRRLAKDQEVLRTCPGKSWWYNTLGRIT